MLYVYITYLHTECVLYIRIQTGKSVKFINFILHIRQKCDLKSFLWRSGSRSNPKVSNVNKLGQKKKVRCPGTTMQSRDAGRPFWFVLVTSALNIGSFLQQNFGKVWLGGWGGKTAWIPCSWQLMVLHALPNLKLGK